MKKNNLNATYWGERYRSKNTPWELYAISPPLKLYIDQLTDKTIKILIPGCGSGNDAKYLWQNGFKNIYVNDVSEEALEEFKTKIPDFPEEQILMGSFFDLEDRFNLILEQTFFCALRPELRATYVKKSNQLLNSNGKIVGLFFDFPLIETGPPFGGEIKDYKKLFSKTYTIKLLETSYNSVESRKNKELFFIFEKA